MSTLYWISFNAEMKSCTVYYKRQQHRTVTIRSKISNIVPLYRSVNSEYLLSSQCLPVLRTTHLLPPQVE